MKIFARDLKENQNVETTFLVLQKEIRQKPTGEPYLSLILGDKTGDVDSKMWNNVAEILSSFEQNDYVKVQGQAIKHKNRLQLRIDRLRPVADRDIDPTDYFPASKRDRDEMYAELMGHVAGIRNPHLKALLEAFFADEEIARRYKIAPAAKTIHHAWIGGLIEHVLVLAKLAKMSATVYPDVDEDLLMTGVILHDIGKIYELNYDRAFGYSDEGQLVGHILIGLRLLGDKVREVPGFPPKLRTLVEHLIASHHGLLEYGSPKTPAFLEAMLLHHLDNLDSKMEAVRGTVANDSNVDGNWTGYSSSLDRSLLKKDRYLEDAPPKAVVPVHEPAPAPSPVPPKPAGGLFADKLTSALKGNK